MGVQWGRGRVDVGFKLVCGVRVGVGVWPSVSVEARVSLSAWVQLLS